MPGVDDALPLMDPELFSFVLFSVHLFHVFFHRKHTDLVSWWNLWDVFMRSLEIFEHLVTTDHFRARPRPEIFVLSLQVLLCRNGLCCL